MQDDFADLIPRFDTRGMDLQLDRMEAALKGLGKPCVLGTSHSGGRNEREGVHRRLSGGCFEASRNQTGLTTSPHLVSWCERIQVDGNQIPEPTLRKRLIELQSISQEHQLTPFEQLLAVVFVHFQANAVDLLVLEVGLGGRLDATTAHPDRPVIAMAAIGLDHCEHLGSTLTAISEEKGAVISPKATVISAEQHPEVSEVLERICRERSAQLHWVDPLPQTWQLGLAGTVQRSNAAVALGALQALDSLLGSAGIGCSKRFC